MNIGAKFTRYLDLVSHSSKNTSTPAKIILISQLSSTFFFSPRHSSHPAKYPAVTAVSIAKWYSVHIYLKTFELVTNSLSAELSPLFIW